MRLRLQRIIRAFVVAAVFGLFLGYAQPAQAAVQYKASGTMTGGTSAITPPYPTGGNAPAANDICFLIVTSENQTIGLTTANGFVEVGTYSPQSAGTAATEPALRIAVFWKRAAGGDSNPVVTDAGNHTIGQIHCFTGVRTSGNPWEIGAGGNDSAANDTSGVIPGASTSTAGTTVLLIQGTSKNAASSAECGTMSNSNLTGITEHADQSLTTGLGSGHCIATGTWASTGDYGSTTLTMATTTYKGAISLALVPAPSVTLSGTASGGIVEQDIVDGGKTIILTLTADTWVAAGTTFDNQRQNIINGIDSAQSEGSGWDAVVKAGLATTTVVRTSSTVVTITLSAFGSYNITATETITATVPATALTGGGALVATPTMTVGINAISFANLGVTSGTSATNPDILNNADQTSYSTASDWTPPTAGLILAFVGSGATNDHPASIPTVSGNSLTWVLVHSAYDGTRRVSLFAALASGATTGSTTFNFGALFTQNRVQVSFVQVTGAHLSDGVQGAFEQVQEASSSAATTGSIGMNAATDSNNRVIAAWFHGTSEATTPEAGWTEVDDMNNASPAGGFETAYHATTFDTTPTTQTWTSSGYVGIAAEIRVVGGTRTNLEQKSFRIRSTDAETINSTSGWAQSINTNASIVASQDFRIRFEVEHASGGSVSPAYELWYSRDGGDYQYLPTNSAARTEDSTTKEYGAMTITSQNYTDLAATTDILTGAGASSTTFVAGTGNHDAEAPSVTLADSRHTELEFTLIMRKLFDIRGHNPDGTTYDFQLRKSGGGRFTTYTQIPRITLANNPGHIGGAVPENPMNMMRMDDNGNLYYLCEYSDTSISNYRSNNPLFMKSTDGGDTWAPVGESTGPASLVHDLEAVDIDHRDDTFYIIIQGPSTDTAFYYEFNTSANGTTPDSWTVLDQSIQTASTVGNQQVSIVKRASEAVVMYRGAVVSTREQLYYEARTAGAWAGTQTRLDTEASRHFRGAGMVRDSNDLIHVVYSAVDGANGYIYNQTINASNVLGTRTQIYTDGALGASEEEVIITPPFIWNNGGTETVGVGFKKGTDNKLYLAYWDIASPGTVNISSAISDGTVADGSAANGGGQHIIASMSVNDATDTIYAYYSNASDTNDLYYDSGTTSGGFGTDVEAADGVNVHWLRTQKFTHSAGNGSDNVIGYIWDNGSDGSTGHSYYDELVLSAPASTFTQNKYRWYVDNNATDPTDPWSSITNINLAENTAITISPPAYDPPSTAQELRLRVNITVGTANLSATSKYFKLQYRTGTDSDCSTGSWTDVNTGNAWTYATSGVTDGADIAVLLSDTTTGKGQEYVKSRPSALNHAAVNTSEIMEYDFHIIGGTATSAERYLFRVVESGSDGTATTALGTYTNCAILTTEPGTENLMRHGKSFSAGAENGFYWAD